MQCNLVLALVSYSAYLTLKTGVLLIYMCFVIVNIGLGAINIFNPMKTQTIHQIIGLMTNVGFLVLQLYYLCRAFYLFNKHGKIDGFPDKYGKYPKDLALERQVADRLIKDYENEMRSQMNLFKQK